jgi:pantothenate kinase
MHCSVESLVSGLRHVLADLPGQLQYWLGIVGAPGAGKSTLSQAIAERIGEQAVILPMDGYHYRRRQLDAMPDPAEAHRRRGAPFTFDAKRFVDDLTLARQTGAGSFPSFRHGSRDPVDGDIALDAVKHRLVIVEGNYLLLDDEPWCQLATLFDQTWFIQSDPAVIRRRLVQRFVRNGLSETEALERVESNDMKNAQRVDQQCRPKATRIVVTD